MALDHDPEDNERCLQFSIPEDEDAHFVAVTLPDEQMAGDDLDKAEAWYVQQLYEMTKLKSERSDEKLPTKFPQEQPGYLARIMSDYFKRYGHGDQDSCVRITVTATNYEQDESEKKYRSKYFEPLVLNNVREHHSKEEDEDYEDLKICFENLSEKEEETGFEVHIIFDFILTSDEVSDLDPQPQGFGFQKDQHLTPLEKSLDKSIHSARQILKEMRYMEQRETRMRETSDGINARVHYFSYLSVAILFGVTYIQVGYLKRYFKKKKLM